MTFGIFVRNRTIWATLNIEKMQATEVLGIPGDIWAVEIPDNSYGSVK
jgi:hypothetical protein